MLRLLTLHRYAGSTVLMWQLISFDFAALKAIVELISTVSMVLIACLHDAWRWYVPAVCKTDE